MGVTFTSWCSGSRGSRYFTRPLKASAFGVLLQTWSGCTAPPSGHHHAGLGLLTPAVVHHGAAGPVRTERQAVLTAAYAAHPERFVRKPPTPPALPADVWINAPGPTTLTLVAQHEGRRVMDGYRIPYAELPCSVAPRVG